MSHVLELIGKSLSKKTRNKNVPTKQKAGLDNQLRLVFGKEKEIIEAFKG